MTEDQIAKSGRLRVVIVGGSIAGLTLAHCLHHNDIDFVVLEARKEIAPQVGASIVILPNGARILDQLGLFQDIAAVVEPLRLGRTWTAGGRLIYENDGPLLIEKRTGYPASFLQRRDLLEALSDGIPDKTKIHLSKRVSKVEHTDTEVVVHCQDGSTYSGDIVVGADGVHSTVRSLMQDHIDRSSPGKADKDRKGLSAEYNCIFGLGKPIPGVIPGQTHRTYAEGISTLSFVGEGGRMYWFLFTKLDKRYFGKEIPKYTKADMEKAVKAFLKVHMTESITWDQIWETRTFANMTCVEESKNENWTADRFACLGDAIHKMTPNLGAGGNAAIESAAALANSLANLPKHTLSLQEIRYALQTFYEKRNERANNTCDTANDLTRLEAMSNLGYKLTALYGVPALGDFLVDLTCDAMVGAELLTALPAPAQSLTATMPWDPNSGVGKHESKWRRALWGLPILMVLYAANWDPVARMHGYAFLSDLVAIQTIWYIEGLRRGNLFTAAHLLPTIFGIMYQVRGIGFIAPIYCFLHYVQSPLENYAAADNRMLQLSNVKTIIPTVVLTYIIPTVGMFFAPGLASRQWINGLFWQPFPVYGAILQRILPLLVEDTTARDRVQNPEADLPYLRAAYGFSAAAGAFAYLYLHVASPVSLVEVFFSNLRNPSAALPLLGGALKALRYDQICAFSATTIWTLLSFKDLKQAGKLQAGWGRILGVFAAMNVAVGPGAALSVMWAWREERLAKRRDFIKENQ
ncbi:BcBOA8 protein [Cadophora sp. DSE1049]|nr:BcBOA8 protein [Cadophora sp. DSE1049]